MDEPEPLGTLKGPNATRVLSAAIGNCLSASLLFCLQKARIDTKIINTTVKTTIMRNEKKRFRIAGTRVTIKVEIDEAEEARNRIEKCLEIFEDFCIVTQSVRHGINVQVDVLDQHDRKIHSAG